MNDRDERLMVDAEEAKNEIPPYPERTCAKCGAVAGTGAAYYCNDGGMVGAHRWVDRPLIEILSPSGDWVADVDYEF